MNKINKIASITLVFAFAAIAVGDEKARILTANSIDVLKDLGNVSVVVDVNGFAEQEGFTADAVALRIKSELIENGLNLISNKQSFETAGQGFIYLRVLVLDGQAVITCGFNEKVSLMRAKNTIVIGAETYGKIYVVSHDQKKSNVWCEISKAITDFSIAYMEANKSNK